MLHAAFSMQSSLTLKYARTDMSHSHHRAHVGASATTVLVYILPQYVDYTAPEILSQSLAKTPAHNHLLVSAL